MLFLSVLDGMDTIRCPGRWNVVANGTAIVVAMSKVRNLHVRLGVA
ncbi:MAG: hypothetical protein ACRD40_09885 [Candidatus Acidiferrales bacterium]